MQQIPHPTGAKKSATSRSLNSLQSFETSPDVANVRVSVVAALFSCHEDTIWRWAKEGRLTAKKIGPKVTVFNVGEIRHLLAAA